MTLPLNVRPSNLQQPIPNNPFYSPETTYIQGPYFPAIINSGSGLIINPDGTITVTGGGGGYVPLSSFTAKGDILGATGAGLPIAINVGTDGQALVADSSCSAGVKWGSVGSGGSPATPTVAGIVLGCTTVNNSALGCNALLSNTTGVYNTANGVNALRSNTTGCYNTANGYDALRFNTTGCGNTANGYDALFFNTTGCQNTATGIYALLNNTTGCNNTAIGNNAGCLITSGCLNVAVGSNAQVASPTGSCQLAIGFSATDNWLTGDSTKAIKPGAGVIDCVGSCGTVGQILMSNGANAICWGSPSGVPSATPTVAGIVLGCTTVDNSALGCNALLSNTTGNYNTATGLNALRFNTTGCQNTAIGANALGSNSTGCCNTATGLNALYSNTTGCQNTATGLNALYSNTTGQNNTAYGANALNSNTDGCYNTAIGLDALRFNTTGCCNTAIGLYALRSNTTGCQNTAYGLYALNSNTTGCGNIGIGGINSAGIYDPVYDITTENNRIAMGTCAVTNAYIRVGWTVISDARDKTNVTALPVGLDFVNQLNPVSFQFKESRECDVATGPIRYGFLAQEVLEAEGENPVIVDAEVPEHLKVTNDHFNAVLVKSIQELSARSEKAIQELSDKVNSLQSEINDLRSNG